ncbi:MAG: hypothetical protein WCD86_12340 [Ktedonobacteraceae bacterium]
MLNMLSEQEETGILSSRPPARTRRRRILVRTAVAVIVVCALNGSALLLFAPRQMRTGSRVPTLGTWKLVTSPNPGLAQNNLQAAAADAADDVWVIGATQGAQPQTLIEHWDGHSWKTVNSPNVGTSGPNAPTINNQLNSITSVPSSYALWAVGDAENTNVIVSPPATPTQFSPVNSQSIIESYGL